MYNVPKAYTWYEEYLLEVNMKVNEGSLKFDDSPDNDLESMMTQVLQASKLNTSAGTVGVKINKIFLKSGTQRRQDGTGTVNNITNESDIVDKRISYIRSSDSLKLILSDISTYQNINTKKYLIIYLIFKDVLFNYDDHYLIEDPSRFVNSFSDELANKIVEDNKLINKLITRYQSIEYRNTKELWDSYNTVLKTSLKDPSQLAELIELYGNRPAHDDSISNVKKYMYPYIKEDKWDTYLEELKKLRKVTKRSRATNLTEICTFFEVKDRDYHKNIWGALNLLVKTLGFDFMSTMTQEEIENG